MSTQQAEPDEVKGSGAPQPRPDRQTAPRMAKPEVHAASPALGWYTDTVLYHDVWNRPGLGKRDRSLVTVAALITCGWMAQLKGHIGRALANEVQPVEIVETVAHLAFFAGWPPVMSSVAVMDQVFRDNGVDPETLGQTTPSMVETSTDATSSDDRGPFSTTLRACTDRAVFHDLWSRTELSARDRSLVTITSLVASGQIQELTGYARRGLEDGLTVDELSEVIAHLAFYVGLAKATAAAGQLDEALSAGAIQA